MTPKELALEGLTYHASAGLEVKETCDGKGRGVFATCGYKKGQYLCEYETAKVYPRTEMARHIEEYEANDEGSYILEASVGGKWLCFDATRRFGGVGRYVNHAASGLATARLFPPLMVRGKYRVALMAACDVVPGQEITYDYGCKPEGKKWLMRRPQHHLPSSPHPLDSPSASKSPLPLESLPLLESSPLPLESPPTLLPSPPLDIFQGHSMDSKSPIQVRKFIKVGMLSVTLKYQILTLH